jgi:SPP1 family phage portal protein
MAKVNEFETAKYSYSSGKQRFPDEANRHFTYSGIDELLRNLDHLSKMIQEHQEVQRPRLRTLENYYKGNNETILAGERRKEEHQADNRAIHNFAKYVSQFIQGYMVGIPIKTSYPDEDVDDMLLEMNRINDADEHNSELILDQSIFGRAYELLYRNKDDENRFTIIDVLNTFVIYDDTVERSPVAGVRYFEENYSNDKYVFLYTHDRIYKYNLGEDFKLTYVEENEHAFQGVPIIEYENNRFRQGDFEDVLTLIDLYDGAQSDIANYSQDLNDAILAIFGRFDLDGYGDKNPLEIMKMMKDANLFHFEPPVDVDGREGRADAKYLYKQYDVQGSEAYKSRIANDIHLFTATPNMTDENFSANQSGEAMKYKLFLLEQKRAAKERRFKRSLRDRYRLINNVMRTASEGGFFVSELRITFTENLPKNIVKEMEWFNKAGGQLSQKTMLSQLSFVENADEEIELIQEEESRSPLNRAVEYDFPDNTQTTGDAELDKALNGAQITSVLRIVEGIDEGLLTSEQAIELLAEGLKLNEESARRIVSSRSAG